MSSEIAIEAKGLAKAYRVYPTPMDRLRQALVPRLRRAAAPLLRAMDRPVDPEPYFTEHWALRELSFQVSRGETVGIIGRNGSGKSTLLQLICGTLTPSQGEVKVYGRVAALLELGSGFNPEYTGRENIFLNASVLGLSREETVARLPDMLAFADIGDAVDQPTKTYSSGMAMRLAFSVIAHVSADVLIIDEALAVGDAYFQQKCLRWLRGFQKDGTVLFCSHDTGAVMSFCEHAIWLDKGDLKSIGPAKEVCEAYTTTVRAATQGIAPTLPASAAKPGPAGERRAAPRELPPPPVEARPVIFDHLAESEGFGNGDATITEVGISAPDGGPVPWLIGGEDLAVWMRVRVNRDIFQPIIGFHVKDRLGQPLFGDNSVTTGTEMPPELLAGSDFMARFVFTLPALATGRYAVTTSIASGTLDTHTQHHWVHDAIIFDVHSAQRNGVLLAVPMHEISLSPVGLMQPTGAGPDA